MGKFRETLAESAEGALHLGPERDRVFADLTPEEKERFIADIRAMNILLQGLLKDIYTFINHYTDAKDIWDNVKMLIEGSGLTKDERESQFYDEFEHFHQNKGETIHKYYVRFMTAVKLNRGLKQSNYDQLYAYLKQHEAHANENKMMLERYIQHAIDPLALGRQNKGQGNYARGTVAHGNGGVQNRVGNANPGQARQIKCYNYNGIGHIARNYTQPKQPHTLEYFKDKMLLIVGEYHEVHEMQNDVQLNYVVDLDAEYTSDSNIIPPYEQYVKDNAVQVIQSNVSSMPNDALMMIINDMHKQSAQCVSAN
ncbi:hypothetical protein Tco_0221609 [Tanacetum coccineum]